MQDNRSEFQKRLDRIGADDSRSYTRAKRGTRSGMYDFVEEERRKARKPPWKALLFMFFLCWALLMVLKAYLIADMGEEAYQARLAELQASEDRLGQIGAVLVERGPVSRFLEERLFPVATAKNDAAAENLK